MAVGCGGGKGLSAACVCAVLLAAAPMAHAGKAKARELYRRGMAEYLLEHWDAAIRLFEEGFREAPEAAFLYNIAQAEVGAGRHADAVRYYAKYLDMAPQARDRAQVERAIADEQQLIAASEATPARPPAPAMVAPTLAPSIGTPPGAAPPQPDHAGVQAGSAAPASQRPRARWPVWLGVGAAALVLAGGAVALGVAYTTPRDAAIPTTTAGDIAVSLP